jgi:hypothetical protein
MGMIIFLSFVLLALVRKENHRFIQVLFQLLNTGGNLDLRLKETMRPGSLISVLLMINYLLMFAVCCYLGLTYVGVVENQWQVMLAATIPLLIFVIQFVPPFMVSAFTGASLPLNTLIANTFVGSQLGGMVLLLLALIWSLNPVLSPQAILLFVALFLLIQLSRLFKNSVLLLSNGVSWYYIVLYFCTLEILPLFVAYYYVSLNFSR